MPDNPYQIFMADGSIENPFTDRSIVDDFNGGELEAPSKAERELVNDYTALLELTLNREVSLDNPQFNHLELWESFKLNALRVFPQDKTRANNIIRCFTFRVFTLCVDSAILKLSEGRKSASWKVSKRPIISVKP